MAKLFDFINLSNATHNGTEVPSGWKPLTVDLHGNPVQENFGPITTQAYKGPTGEVVLTIKGTDGDLEDWTVVNKAFGTGDYPKYIQDLVAYANELESSHNPNPGDNNISVAGFSQGGGLSQLLSHTFGWEGNAQNAPGAGNIVDNPAYEEHVKSLGIEARGVPDGFTTITEKGDVVSNTGNHLGATVELDITESFAALCVAMGVAPGASILAVGACLALDTSNQHDMQKLADYINNLSPEQQQELLQKIEEATAESEVDLHEYEFEHTSTAEIAGAGASAAFMSYARLNGWTDEWWLDDAWEQSVASFAVSEAAKDIADWSFESGDYNVFDWNAAGGSLFASAFANYVAGQAGIGGTDVGSTVGIFQQPMKQAA